jgi:hypothetical protein
MGHNGRVEQPGKHAGKRRAEPASKAPATPAITYVPTHLPTHSTGRPAGEPTGEPSSEPAREPSGEPGGESGGGSRLPLFLLALGVTASIVAWGYLVYAAIDFGATARGGDSGAWWLLGLASLGAVACLFVGLLLVTRLLRILGIVKERAEDAPKTPRPVGGKRIAR